MTGTQVQDDNRRALFGWSPPDLPADTAVKRHVDRLLPRWRVRPGRVRSQRLLRAAGQEVTVDSASYPEFASSSSAGPSSAMPNLDWP